jgi:hypothetical protein
MQSGKKGNQVLNREKCTGNESKEENPAHLCRIR